MLSELVVVPPERSEAVKCLERLRAIYTAFDLIFDASMEICDRYGLVGPVGATKSNADSTGNR